MMWEVERGGNFSGKTSEVGRRRWGKLGERYKRASDQRYIVSLKGIQGGNWVMPGRDGFQAFNLGRLPEFFAQG